MTCPRCDGLLVREYLLDPRKELVWRVNGKRKRWRMALENVVTQTTREALSTPMRETFVASRMLAVCCVCGLIRDENGLLLDHERWVTPRTYRKAHGVSPADLPLTHTYCLTCFTKAQETTRQYFREIGTSP